MKKFCSLLLALILCMALVVPASAANNKSEFERLGQSVMQETPETLPLTYVAYNPDDSTLFLVEEGQFEISSCTVTPASKKGYVDIKLTTYAYLDIFFDEYDYIEYNNCIWNSAVYDYYTGIQFNFGSMFSDGERNITTKVRFNERDYMISCSKANEWTQAEWEYIGDYMYASTMTCKTTMTFTVPEGYNGLVYGLYDKTKLSTSDLDFSAPSDKESYLSDFTDQEATFFRFGHNSSKEMPRDGLVLSIYDQGESEPLGYTISNHGTEHVRGYYALLSYWPITDYYPANEMNPYESEYFRGQLLPVNVDLAPGESLSGDCWATATGWSTMTHKWIKFDDKAERDAFFKASVLDQKFGVYEIDTGADGIRWMKNTFGISIYSGKYWGGTN